MDGCRMPKGTFTPLHNRLPCAFAESAARHTNAKPRHGFRPDDGIIWQASF